MDKVSRTTDVSYPMPPTALDKVRDAQILLLERMRGERGGPPGWHGHAAGATFVATPVGAEAGP